MVRVTRVLVWALCSGPAGMTVAPRVGKTSGYDPRAIFHPDSEALGCQVVGVRQQSLGTAQKEKRWCAQDYAFRSEQIEIARLEPSSGEDFPSPKNGDRR